MYVLNKYNVNNVPHLSNLIGSTLSADVFSRYCRAGGINSNYEYVRDVYRTTTKVKDFEEQMTTKEICYRLLN